MAFDVLDLFLAKCDALTAYALYVVFELREGKTFVVMRARQFQLKCCDLHLSPPTPSHAHAIDIPLPLHVAGAALFHLVLMYDTNNNVCTWYYVYRLFLSRCLTVL